MNHPSQCWITDEPKITYPVIVKNVNVDISQMQTQVCLNKLFLIGGGEGGGGSALFNNLASKWLHSPKFNLVAYLVKKMFMKYSASCTKLLLAQKHIALTLNYNVEVQ